MSRHQRALIALGVALSIALSTPSPTLAAPSDDPQPRPQQACVSIVLVAVLGVSFLVGGNRAFH